MIKINLLGDDTGVDHSAKLELLGYAASLVLVFCVFGWMQMSIKSTVAGLNERKETLQAQLTVWQKKTKKVKELEAKREDLKTKLAVIAQLKRNKTGPVRVLDDLNNSIPDRSWLTAIEERGGEMRVEGVALDNQTIARFIEDLEASDYFVTVDLDETKLEKVKDVNMKAFALTTRVNYGGKLSAAKDEAEDADTPKASLSVSSVTEGGAQ